MCPLKQLKLKESFHMDYQHRQFLFSGAAALIFWFSVEVLLSLYLEEASVFLSFLYSLPQTLTAHL